MARRVLVLVMAIAFLAVGGFIAYGGALKALAHVPGAGTRGTITVSRCEAVDRGSTVCYGTFIAPGATPRPVIAEGAREAQPLVAGTVFAWDGDSAYAVDGRRTVLAATGVLVFGTLVALLGMVGVVQFARSRSRARNG